jgi:hypothetical protein
MNRRTCGIPRQARNSLAASSLVNHLSLASAFVGIVNAGTGSSPYSRWKWFTAALSVSNERLAIAWVWLSANFLHVAPLMLETFLSPQ